MYNCGETAEIRIQTEVRTTKGTLLPKLLRFTKQVRINKAEVHKGIR